MKFEYDKKEENRDCVAYIDEDGYLIVKTDNGVTRFFAYDTPDHCEPDWWSPTEEASHKFYPGDKITITF